MGKVKEYDKFNVKSFIECVKVGCLHSHMISVSFNDLCREYKLGQGNTRYAFEELGLIRFEGRGFKNWIWTGPEVTDEFIDDFISALMAYNGELKKYREGAKKKSRSVLKRKVIQMDAGKNASFPFMEPVKQLEDRHKALTIELNNIGSMIEQFKNKVMDQARA